MKQHPCLKIIPRETDYLYGDGHIEAKSIYNGDWSSYIDFYESQRVANGDTDDCVIFTFQESVDAQIEAMLPSLPAGTIELFNQMGFMDTDSLDGNAHFHSSPRFIGILTGNGTNGNPLQAPWDAMRKYGIVPWKDLPVSPTMTIDEYFTPIPQNLLAKGQQFLAAIGGKNSVQYHWIANGKENIPAMMVALEQSPVCLGTPVCEPWDQNEPPVCSGQNAAHSTMCYKITGQDVYIYDHYQPANKILQSGYPIPFSLQGIVSVNPPPPAPVLPVNPTPAQELTWLQALVGWLKNILSSISPSGRARLQGASRSSKWPSVEKAFLKLNPECKVCGTKQNQNVHHISPFHLDPAKELSLQNLITLCRPHHFLFGHFMNWSSFNSDVRVDSANWNTKIKGRPQ